MAGFPEACSNMCLESGRRHTPSQAGHMLRVEFGTGPVIEP
jgi:hypothetical protein